MKKTLQLTLVSILCIAWMAPLVVMCITDNPTLRDEMWNWFGMAFICSLLTIGAMWLCDIIREKFIDREIGGPDRHLYEIEEAVIYNVWAESEEHAEARFLRSADKDKFLCEVRERAVYRID